jgi:hypothetical protein
MRAAASVLLILAFLTACASTDTPSPAPGSSTRPGLEGIAASYLELVATSNAATCDFNAVLSQSAPTLPDLKKASADYVNTLGTLIDGLRAIDWPSELTADASALTDALVVSQTHTRAMADADTLETFIAADNELIAANGVAADAASKVRDDLGLPSGKNPCS